MAQICLPTTLVAAEILIKINKHIYPRIYTTQNLLRITFSFNDLMLKTNRLKKDFFYKDRLIF